MARQPSGIPGVSVHAVIFGNGQVTDLGTLGGLNSTGIGINASGQVAGYSEIVGNPPYRHAFLYTPGNGLRDIGTLAREVDAQTGKKIQPAIAAKLISDDAAIQAALSCPY